MAPEAPAPLRAPRVSALIVNWNTCVLLKECLESLSEECADGYADAIIVDNGSSDGSPAMIRAEFPEATLIANQDNLGFVRGNNQAHARSISDADYILLLNSDARLHAGSLRTMVDWMDSHPKFGACGPMTLNTDGTLQPTWSRFPTLWTEIRGVQDRRFIGATSPPPLTKDAIENYPPSETDWLGGSCLLIRRAALRRDLADQLLDPVYAMYCEETDLCFRLRRSGWKVALLPAAAATHHGGQSSRQMPIPALTMMYQSKVIFFRQHYGPEAAFLLRLGLGLAAAVKWLIAARSPIEGRVARARQRAVIQAALR